MLTEVVQASPPGQESFSDFYLNYARNIQQIISSNATAEFEAIWAEHEESGRPYTLISDDLSQRLLKLQNDLEDSPLYDDEKLRKAVMTRALPKVLLEQIGLEKIMKRLPESYARSIFSSYVASVSFSCLTRIPGLFLTPMRSATSTPVV